MLMRGPVSPQEDPEILQGTKTANLREQHRQQADAQEVVHLVLKRLSNALERTHLPEVSTQEAMHGLLQPPQQDSAGSGKSCALFSSPDAVPAAVEKIIQGLSLDMQEAVRRAISHPMADDITGLAELPPSGKPAEGKTAEPCPRSLLSWP